MDKGKIKFDDVRRFSHEWIKSLGIFPLVAQVAWLLRERGFDVTPGVFNSSGTGRKIQLKVLGKKS